LAVTISDARSWDNVTKLYLIRLEGISSIRYTYYL